MTGLMLIGLVGLFIPATVASATPPTCPVPGLTDRCAEWGVVVDHEPGHAGGAGTDVLVASAVSADAATVYAAGYSQSASGDLDATLIATDAATGEPRWSVRWGGSAGESDTFLDLAVGRDGTRVYVVGGQDVNAAAGTGDYLVAALDAGTGDQLWAAAYDHGGFDVAQAVAVGAAHSGAPVGAELVYVTGQSEGDGMDAATLAIDGIHGTTRWVDRFAEASGFIPWDSTSDVVVDARGDRVYVAGSTSNAATGTYDGLVVAYESGRLDDEETQVGGRRVWTRRVPTASLVRLAALDGAVVAVGKAWRDPSPVGGFEASDMLAILLEAEDGDVRWTDRVSGAGPTMGENLATAVATSDDLERVYVAGIVSGVVEGDDDMGILAYDVGAGARLWSASYAAPGHIGDAPLDVLEAGETVVVTGVSSPTIERLRMFSNPSVAVPISGQPVQADATTFGLEAATGDRGWTARFNGSDMGADFAYGWSLAEGGGRVFVAGQTGRVARPEDVEGSNRNHSDGILVAYGLD